MCNVIIRMSSLILEGIIYQHRYYYYKNIVQSKKSYNLDLDELVNKYLINGSKINYNVNDTINIPKPNINNNLNNLETNNIKKKIKKILIVQ